MSNLNPIFNFYQGKRILVTGATGFVGRHLLAALNANFADYAIISKQSASHVSITGKVFAGNLQDEGFVRDVFNDWKPAIVFHLAGTRGRGLSNQAFQDSISNNLNATLHVLLSARDCPGVDKIVMMGSAEEYGANIAPYSETMREAPVSAYSFSKQSATHLAQLLATSSDLPVVILRPSVIYGPGQQDDMFLPALINALLRGKQFPMTPGEQTRDYLYVDDAVEAILLSGEREGTNGHIINIGSGQPTSMLEIARTVEKLANATGLVLGGALSYRIGEPMNYWLDIDKAKAMLQWSPRTELDEGLERTVRWYAERP